MLSDCVHLTPACARAKLRGHSCRFAVFDEHDDNGEWARMVRDALQVCWKWANAVSIDADHARLVSSRQEMCFEVWHKPEPEPDDSSGASSGSESESGSESGESGSESESESDSQA